MKNLEKIVSGETVYLDGSMGAILIDNGIDPNFILDANIDHADLVESIHKKYIQAGSDIILTNTFNLTEDSLSHLKYDEELIVNSALDNALKASCEISDVAFDISPSGVFPIGKENYNFDNAYNLYKRLLSYAKNKADLIFIESISLIEDIQALCKAASDTCDLPIFASMTFTEKKHTWFGYNFDDWLKIIPDLPLTAVGLNCSLSPLQMLHMIQEMKEKISIPVFAKPNRGQPVIIDNKADYNMSSDTFAEEMLEIYKSGIKIIGGCCGSDSECIIKMKSLISDYDSKID